MTTQLITLKDFFEVVVKENRETHRSPKASLVTVVNYANSLWSLREWAFVRKQREIETYLAVSMPLKQACDLEEPLTMACPDWSQISAVANGLKHVELRKPKLGHLHDAKDMKVEKRGYGVGGFGVGRWGGTTFVIRTDQGDKDFDAVSESVFQFWETMIPNL